MYVYYIGISKAQKQDWDGTLVTKLKLTIFINT